MQPILIDTNVFMRLFDLSDPAQTAKAKNLFVKAASGSIALVVAPPVLFELAWVLRSALKRSNEEVLDILEAIMTWQGLKVSDNDYVQTAISLARKKGQSFADAYICVTAQKQDFKVVTFNTRHFEKFGVPLYSPDDN
ncbi:MAG: PIN domain-containing protein [Synergistaceae bacterium]|nr:PIN domain-containing protein [Synergistaceae bacterium]